jgi:hypothetical protein
VTGPEAEARAAVTLAFVRALLAVRDQVGELEGRIREQLELHRDGPIFRSLPRAGQIRAAALLAEIGDVRERFPTPESLACLAGAAPSTRQSGQHMAVTFRFACDKKLRDALVDFAEDSRFANPWAAKVYGDAIERHKTHPTPAGSSQEPGCTSVALLAGPRPVRSGPPPSASAGCLAEAA